MADNNDPTLIVEDPPAGATLEVGTDQSAQIQESSSASAPTGSFGTAEERHAASSREAKRLAEENKKLKQDLQQMTGYQQPVQQQPVQYQQPVQPYWAPQQQSYYPPQQQAPEPEWGPQTGYLNSEEKADYELAIASMDTAKIEHYRDIKDDRRADWKQAETAQAIVQADQVKQITAAQRNVMNSYAEINDEAAAQDILNRTQRIMSDPNELAFHGGNQIAAMRIAVLQRRAEMGITGANQRTQQQHSNYVNMSPGGASQSTPAVSGSQFNPQTHMTAEQRVGVRAVMQRNFKTNDPSTAYKRWWNAQPRSFRQSVLDRGAPVTARDEPRRTVWKAGKQKKD